MPLALPASNTAPEHAICPKHDIKQRMLLSTLTGQHTVPHDLRYNMQVKHMMEVVWAILESLSMFDGRCLQAGSGNQARYSTHFDRT